MESQTISGWLKTMRGSVKRTNK